MQDKNISSENLTENELKTRLQHLSEENERLAREVTELKNELREYKGKSAWHSRDDKYQHALRHRADTEYMFSKNNYASFLFAQLKCTSFFQIYKRAVNAFRKYSFITTSLKVFSIIFENSFLWNLFLKKLLYLPDQISQKYLFKKYLFLVPDPSRRENRVWRIWRRTCILVQFPTLSLTW